MPGCTHLWLTPGPLGSITCRQCGVDVRGMRRQQPFDGDEARVRAAMGQRVWVEAPPDEGDPGPEQEPSP